MDTPSTNATPSSELSDCIQRLRFILRSLIEVIDALIAVTIGHPPVDGIREVRSPLPQKIAETLPLMLQAAGSSSNTLVRLSDGPGLHTRDCYSIARSVVEVSVNICYIIAEGESAASRALRHARQKAVRELERESRMGDNLIRLAYDGRPDLFSPGLEEDIAEFTSRAGREKCWIDASIDKRIEFSGLKLGEPVLTNLHFARFMIYRHSSEILHGTLFGAAYFFGLTDPSVPRTLEERAESVGRQHMLILLGASISLAACIAAFHKVYGFEAADRKSESLVDLVSQIPYFRRRLHPEPEKAPNPAPPPDD